MPKTTDTQTSSVLSGVLLNVGSFLTSLRTIDSISAVTFTISLWQSVTNSSVSHVKAWSMFHFPLQAHSCVKCLSSNPYLNKTTSKNSHLLNENLSCFTGKDYNHIEGPSGATISLAFNCAGVILL